VGGGWEAPEIANIALHSFFLLFQGSSFDLRKCA